MVICGKIPSSDDNVFTTDSYLMGQYEGRIRRKLPNLSKEFTTTVRKLVEIEAVRIVQERDGIYSLPLDYQQKLNGSMLHWA